jgi:hypothetical protein
MQKKSAGGHVHLVSFQYPLLRSSAYLRRDPSGAVRVTSGFPLLRLADVFNERADALRIVAIQPVRGF